MSEIEVERGQLIHPGDLLREEIKNRRLRQSDICRDLNISEKHLSEVLNGKALPSVGLTIELSDYLGISPRTVWSVRSRYVLDKALGERAANT